MERAGGSTARPAPWAEVQGTRARAVAALPARWSAPTPPRGLPWRNPSTCPPPRAANSPDGARIARRAPGERAARGNNSSSRKGRGVAAAAAPPARGPSGGRGRTCNASLIAMGACAAIAAGGRGTALQARARSVKSKVRLVNEQARASASASYSCMPWCARARATPTPKRPNRAQPVPGACTRTVCVQRPWGSPDIPRAASSARDEARSHDLTKSRRELERPRRPGAGQGVAMQTAAGALEVPTARRAFTAPRRGPRVPVEAPWRLATPDRSTWPLEVGIKEIKQKKKKEELESLHRRCGNAQCQSAQLNTIRHVVIWLDPWSRERDLLAAVVHR